MSERQHTCDVCGKQDVWSPSWSWFGSINDLESGRPIVKMCSDACAAAVRKATPPIVDVPGTITREITYSIRCGACDTEEPLEGGKDRDAEQAGWHLHATAGWLCAACAPRFEIRDAAREAACAGTKGRG